MKKLLALCLAIVVLFFLSGCYTREDIETIRYNAREEGYNDGWNEGYEEGVEVGEENGRYEGYLEGYQDGCTDTLYDYGLEE